MTDARMARISEFCTTGSGGTPPRDRFERYYANGKIPWVKSGELREGVILDTEEHITDLAVAETNVKEVPAGALLLAMYGATVGRMAILGVRATTNQAVCHIVPDTTEGDVRYIFHALRNQLDAIIRQGVGGAQPNISQGIVRNLRVPLPSLSEQRRIAEILDEADALRAKRRTAIAELDKLTQSVFLDMFGAPHAHRWTMSTVAQVAAHIDGAIRTGPFGSQLLHEEFSENGGIAVLGIDNVVENRFRWVQRRYISEAKYRQLARYTVRPDDVLITIMGTCGRCAIVPHNIPLAINTKHLCCITLDHAKCLPAFLHAYFLQHPIARRHLSGHAKGAIMEGLNMDIIKKMPIPLAPMVLQEVFSAKLAALEALKLSEESARAECQELFSSLQHRAFAGAL